MADSSETLLRRLHEHQDVVRNVARAIDDVAFLLDEVGMERLANRLGNATGALCRSIDELDHAYGDDLSSRLRDSKAMTGSILLATLRGCFVPPTASPSTQPE